MTTATRLGLFVRREMSNSLRARWFLLYSAVFFLGGLLLIAFGARDAFLAGYRGYARSLAGLVHFSILFVPLMALFPASAAIAEERENGTLEYLLAQPVGRGEVFAGKWAGVALAVVASITFGYLFAGGLAMLRGVPASFIWTSYLFLLLFACVFVSIGLTLSTVFETRSRAVTVGLLLWLALIALGSLGAMAAFIRWGWPVEALIAWSFLNPVEAFRLAQVALLDADLGLLGPVGASMAERHGAGMVLWGSALSLLAWVVVPLALGGTGVLRRREGA